MKMICSVVRLSKCPVVTLAVPFQLVVSSFCQVSVSSPNFLHPAPFYTPLPAVSAVGLSASYSYVLLCNPQSATFRSYVFRGHLRSSASSCYGPSFCFHRVSSHLLSFLPSFRSRSLPVDLFNARCQPRHSVRYLNSALIHMHVKFHLTRE